jgi:N,N'-diacetyllegionaminate synthase
MSTFKIDQIEVGDGCRPFVIAEIGVNHDGDVHRALQLVAAAAGAGADAVKLQIFRANTLLHASAAFADYQKDAGAASPADMLRQYELSSEDIRRVVARIRELKMIPIATPFSPSDLEIIDAMRLPAIKIASPDIVNRPLLEAAAIMDKPLLISTGAATLDEIRTTVGWLAEWGCTYALLHCVSSYPTPTADVNLCWIDDLWQEFGGVIGYSDHCKSVLSGALAVAAGATILERHLTYDRRAKGPDHSASSDAGQFERYVQGVHEASAFRGTRGKHVLPCEEDVRSVSRQSLVLRRSVSAGEVVLREHLTVQRPGTGMPAAMINQAIGRRMNRFVQAGAMLQPDMLDAA